MSQPITRENLLNEPYFFAKFLCYFSHNFVFFLIISDVFPETFALFFSENFPFFRETDRSEKNENFLFHRKPLVQSHTIISETIFKSSLTVMFRGKPCSCFQSFVRLRFVYRELIYIYEPFPLCTINSNTLFCIITISSIFPLKHTLKELGPDRFSRFDVFWIKTSKKAKYINKDFNFFFLLWFSLFQQYH